MPVAPKTSSCAVQTALTWPEGVCVPHFLWKISTVPIDAEAFAVLASGDGDSRRLVQETTAATVAPAVSEQQADLQMPVFVLEGSVDQSERSSINPDGASSVVSNMLRRASPAGREMAGAAQYNHCTGITARRPSRHPRNMAPAPVTARSGGLPPRAPGGADSLTSVATCSGSAQRSTTSVSSRAASVFRHLAPAGQPPAPGSQLGRSGDTSTLSANASLTTPNQLPVPSDQQPHPPAGGSGPSSPAARRAFYSLASFRRDHPGQPIPSVPSAHSLAESRSSLISRRQSSAAMASPNNNRRVYASPGGAQLQQQQQLGVLEASHLSGLSHRCESFGAASVVSQQERAAAHHTTFASVESENPDDGMARVNQYLLLGPIGSGSQGEVQLAEDVQLLERRAVKIVRRPAGAKLSPAAGGAGLAAARQRQAAALDREVAALRQCRHKNIVALYEVIDDPAQNCMYLVMQYVDRGALANMRPDGTTSCGPLDCVTVTRYARQLCAGLQYLHGKGIVHRDIKPDNLLVDSDGTVYLSDFGMAELFKQGDADDSGVPTVAGVRGTVPFMAPELLAGSHDGVDGKAIDVWALGVTFYCLLFGKLPWALDGTHGDLVKSIVHTDVVVARPPVVLPDSMAPQQRDVFNESFAQYSQHTPSLQPPTSPSLHNGGRQPPTIEQLSGTAAFVQTSTASDSMPARNSSSDAARALDLESDASRSSVASGGGVQCTPPASLAHRRFMRPGSTTMAASVASSTMPSASALQMPLQRNARDIGDRWQRLLQRMLDRRPSARPDIAEVRTFVRHIAKRAAAATDVAASFIGSESPVVSPMFPAAP